MLGQYSATELTPGSSVTFRTLAFRIDRQPDVHCRPFYSLLGLHLYLRVVSKKKLKMPAHDSLSGHLDEIKEALLLVLEGYT